MEHCLYSGTRCISVTVWEYPDSATEENLRHIAPNPPGTGFGRRRRELDFFSFFRFMEGFFDGGAFLLPARTFRDDGASVAAAPDGGILPDAIICSSSSLWYAWWNVNGDRCTCELNMCGR